MDLQPATNVNSGAVLLQQQLRKTLGEREREREREIERFEVLCICMHGGCLSLVGGFFFLGFGVSLLCVCFFWFSSIDSFIILSK